MAPFFNIAEANPIAVYRVCDHGLAFFHLIADVFFTAFGNTGSSCLCRFFHFSRDCSGVMCIATMGYAYDYVLFHFVICLLVKKFRVANMFFANTMQR